MTAVLGLDAVQSAGTSAGPERAALDSLIQDRLLERSQARAAKDWARADAIRDALAAAGVVVEDTADGAVWSLEEA